MVFADPVHMPMHHGLPLSEFLSEVLIFVGLFISIHAFLDWVRAGDKMSILIGLIIITIGCLVYVITRDKKSSFDGKRTNNIYENDSLRFNTGMGKHL